MKPVPLKPITADEEPVFRQKAKEQLLNFKPSSDELRVGVEVEAAIYKAKVGLGVAVPITMFGVEQPSLEIIERLPEDVARHFSPELGSWSIEFKSDPFAIAELPALFKQLWALEDSFTDVARANGDIIFLKFKGVLPYDSTSPITHMTRYRLLAEQIPLRRGSTKVSLQTTEGDFKDFIFYGLEDFTFLHSAHIHVSSSLEDVALLHNAASLLSGIMVALAANGNTFKFHDLNVSDPRIPLFETLVDVRSQEERQKGMHSSVGFPDRFFSSYDDAMELYSSYPLVLSGEPEGDVLLGQVWKWVRMKKYGDAVGVELRVMASNKVYWLERLTRLYLGLLLYLKEEEAEAFSKERESIYKLAKHCFYSCAFKGMEGDAPSLKLSEEVRVRGNLKSSLQYYVGLANTKLREHGLDELNLKELVKIRERFLV